MKRFLKIFPTFISKDTDLSRKLLLDYKEMMDS